MANNAPPDPAPEYVAEALADAERLLKYAAEFGVDVDAGIRNSVLHARAVGPSGLDEKTVADLLAALTKLAAQLTPVTAESLKYQCKDRVHLRVQKYKTFAIYLGICIVLSSFISFITTALSHNISDKIDTANNLAVKLQTELGPKPASSPGQTNDLSTPPPGVSQMTVITDLQQYASTIRDINSRAGQLNWFIGCTASEYHLENLKRMAQTNAPESFAKFQLQVGLPDLWQEQEEKTGLYQHVRAFAQNVIDTISMFYGAIGSCILPVLYALFGTCASLLRNYEQQTKARTFIPSSSDSTHLCLAGICGAVVGLFNINITQGVSASPLAIAFLVGYGVDVFFSFLEGLLQMFIKGKGSS